MAAPEVLRGQARQQVKQLTAEQVEARLRDRPVSDLRGLAGLRARIGHLERHGFRTVADVRKARPHRLSEVPGVGPTTAEQVSHAARVLAAKVAKETRVRIDPDRRTASHTQLLATLAAVRAADSAASTLREPLERFVTQTQPLVPEAERATSKWNLFWAGRGKKRSALDALAQLDRILADPRVVAISDALDQVPSAVDPGSYAPDQLWYDYEVDAASFNSLLSTVGGAGETDDLEASQGFIDPELRQKITAVPLDTSLMRATLRNYQVFGAQYAVHQERSILGDEMGLGKTVEALAVFAHMAARGQRRFMVVCPASVQMNWLKEIERHTQLTAYSLHGRDREATGRRWLRQGGVAVTTFTTLGSLRCIADADIAMLVVDEAHYAKNPDAKRSQRVKAVSDRAQRTLFLTGTPMENRVEEFRNLVGYLQPRVAARIDPSDGVAGAKAFRRAVAPVYLRRNQEDVLTELPDKIEVEDWVQLTRADEVEYRQAVVRRNLMAMRQAAYVSADSAKLERLTEIVEEALEDGLKVVVFSYFLGVLDTIHSRLGSAVAGVLTGSVPPATRQQLVDAYTHDREPSVMLSQIEAGGVGLNIQAASVVVLAEPQWKPSTEDQAIARAYRMGQIRKVQVHRILAKESVDDRMIEVQEQKRLLFDEYARKSDAKDADTRAVDGSLHRPADLDDPSISRGRRIIIAEQHRLGIDEHGDDARPEAPDHATR